MKRYKVTRPVTLTAQSGSIVVLTDQQAEAVRGAIVEVSTEKAKNNKSQPKQAPKDGKAKE